MAGDGLKDRNWCGEKMMRLLRRRNMRSLQTSKEGLFLKKEAKTFCFLGGFDAADFTPRDRGV
jgi:hypothetical protein